MFNLIGEVIVDNIEYERAESLLMKKIEALSLSHWFMDALSLRVAESQSLISPMTAHVKHHRNKEEKQHSLAQRFQREFLGTTYQPCLAMAQVEARVVTTLTRTPSNKDLDEEYRRRGKRHNERREKGNHRACCTSLEGDEYEKRNSRSRKAPVLEEPGVSSSNAKVVIERKSKDLPNGFRKSKKPEVLGSVNDQFRAALDFSTYSLIEISSLSDSQVGKHVAQSTSKLRF